jgi:tRNA(fMet)-specific endonuclease VapC
VILDTDILGAIVSPRCPERVVKELADAEGPIYTTAVNWAEIACGLARHARGDRLRRAYETRVLPALEILAFDQECAEVYGRVRARLEKKGECLGEADLMIAAIALHHGLTLVSGNTRHFSRVPGLKLVNWLQG